MLHAAALLIALVIPASDAPRPCEPPACVADTQPAASAPLPPEIIPPDTLSPNFVFPGIAYRHNAAAERAILEYRRTVQGYIAQLQQHRAELLADSLSDTMTLEQQFDALRKKLAKR